MDDDVIRLVVVTRHQLFRDSIRALLSTARVKVVGEAESLDQACKVIELLQPEAALFDIELPTPPTRETVSTLQTTAPRTHLIALGSMHDEALKSRLIARGVSSYISKESRGCDLMALLRDVLGGRAGITLSDIQPTVGPADALSEREHAVLRLVAQSMTNAQIARRLDISEATVKRHLHNIFRKLGAVSRMDAVHKVGFAPMPTAPTSALWRSSPRAVPGPLLAGQV